MDQLRWENRSALSFRIAGVLYGQGVRFYRGVGAKREGDFFIQLPVERPSIAKTVNGNTVNRMLSEVFSSWSAYPRRTFAICIGTSFDIAKEYAKEEGVVYSVFPEDGTMLAIAPAPDFTCSFHDKRCKVNVFIGEVLARINERFFKNSFDLDSADDINGFFERLDSLESRKKVLLIEEIVTALPCSEGDAHFRLLGELADAENTKEYVENYLHPDKNGFRLGSLHSDLSFLKGTEHEVWMESPCLMVNHEFVDPFLKILAGEKAD